MEKMKPKIGLLMLAAGWFWEKGIQGSEKGRYNKLSAIVEKDTEKIIEKLKEHLDLVESGLVHSIDKAAKAVQKFKKSRIELLIVCHLMWSEDQPLIKVLNEMSQVPLLLWCYSPHKKLPARINSVELFRGSGPVGTLQSSIVIKKSGRDFDFVIGSPDEDDLIKTIVEFAEAAHLVRELKDIKVGLIPYRCELMADIYVDEFRLMRQIGPSVKYISIAEFSSAMEKIEEADVVAYVNDLKSKYEIHGVSDKSLFRAAKSSMALVKVAKMFNLDAIALDDINEELHKMIGLRPCLYPPSLNEMGMIIGMEGDITGTIAMLVLNRLSGQPAMFAEIFAFDKTDNSIVAGHAGPQNTMLVKNDERIKIIPDREYDTSSELEGAWMYFMAKPGRVTMLNLICEEDNFKMVVAGGEALAGPEKLEGFPHIHIKLDVPVERFFAEAAKTGVTHHWAVVHADVIDKLESLADMIKLKKVVIK